MKKFIRFFMLFAVMFTCFCVNVSAEGTVNTVTYTISNNTTVAASGTEIDGSTAVYATTYTTEVGKLTKDNNLSLTLNNIGTIKVNSIVLSMHSNSSGGSGNITLKSGADLSASNGEKAQGTFSKWNGSYSTSYVDVSLDITNPIMQDKLEIKVSATANSLYIQSFTITYEEVTITKLSTPTASIADKVVTINPVEHASGYTVNLYTDGGELVSTFDAVASDALFKCDLSSFAAQGSFKYSVCAVGDQVNYMNSDFTVQAPAFVNSTIETKTISEFKALVDETNLVVPTYYQVTGVITSANNTSVYIEDDTDSIQIYRGTYGEYAPAVGDTLTVKGYVGSYNSNKQIQGATYVSHIPNYGKNFEKYDVMSSIGFSYDSTYAGTRYSTITASELADGDKIVIASDLTTGEETTTYYLSYKNNNNYKASSNANESLVLSVVKDSTTDALSFKLPNGNFIGVKSAENYFGTAYDTDGEKFTVNAEGLLVGLNNRTIGFNAGTSKLFNSYSMTVAAGQTTSPYQNQNPIKFLKVNQDTTTVSDLKLQFKVDIPTDFPTDVTYKAEITINGTATIKAVDLQEGGYLSVAVSDIPAANYSTDITVAFICNINGTDYKTAEKTMSVSKVVDAYINSYVGSSEENAKVFTVGVYNSLLKLQLEIAAQETGGQA